MFDNYILTIWSHQKFKHQILFKWQLGGFCITINFMIYWKQKYFKFLLARSLEHAHDHDKCSVSGQRYLRMHLCTFNGGNFSFNFLNYGQIYTWYYQEFKNKHIRVNFNNLKHEQLEPVHRIFAGICRVDTLKNLTKSSDGSQVTPWRVKSSLGEFHS